MWLPHSEVHAPGVVEEFPLQHPDSPHSSSPSTPTALCCPQHQRGTTSLLSFLIFVCPLPHLHHLPTPSNLIHLPSATSTPTLRFTCPPMLSLSLPYPSPTIDPP